MIELRPEVRSFAEAMEVRLRVNDYKGGWKKESAANLSLQLEDEVEELTVAIVDPTANAEDILHEAADVANFAMMIADVRGAL